MTGRGFGNCVASAGNRVLRRGRARGIGSPFSMLGHGPGMRGMGRRAFSGDQGSAVPGSAFSSPTRSAEQELSDLRQQAQLIQDDLEQIQSRIKKLDLQP